VGACTRSSHVGCLAVAGSLISHTVWSRSGRSSTWVMPIARASMFVLPRGSPGTVGGFPGVRCCDAAVLRCYLMALDDAKTCSSPPIQLICQRSTAAPQLENAAAENIRFPPWKLAPDPSSGLPDPLCLGSRLPTLEIPKLPRLPTLGPRVGR